MQTASQITNEFGDDAPQSGVSSSAISVAKQSKPLGYWAGDSTTPVTARQPVRDALHNTNQAIALLQLSDQIGLVPADAGQLTFGNHPAAGDAVPIVGFAPALHPAQLGDATFCTDHKVRWPYMLGAMANGIASADLVEAAARAGMLASYGAAGQSIDVITKTIDRLQANLSDLPYAFNLIHSPNEPAHEAAVVELYIQRGVHLVEASAYLDLTLTAVRYRTHGIHRDSTGRIVTPNRIIAKVSRVEVAAKWLSPPPRNLLDQLVAQQQLTNEQAEMASHVPMADDLTAEADSGGHTDNRPAITLIPTMIALRDRIAAQYKYDRPLRVGAAGGIATPASAAAAFAMGAAYIVTGTVNQACIESGSSDGVRQMLAKTQQADTIMAPAADMFEMGVKLQVLKRGTMFAMRAQKLFELYRQYDHLDAIPAADRASLEKTVFRASLDEIWDRTRQYFGQYDPAQVARAETDGKHKMALVFRWYLGLSSRWANAGETDRQIDYQVWCGPAMGAFNEWTADTFLAEPAARDVATVGLNLLAGAAVVTRLNMLRSQGVVLPADLTKVAPMPRAEIESRWAV